MMISNLLQVDFEEYAAKAKTLPVNTTKKSKLFLYGLYYQATVGPVNTRMCSLIYSDSLFSIFAKQNFDTFIFCFFAGWPGIFNMRDRAKWEAWKAVEGLQNPLDKSYIYKYK